MFSLLYGCPVGLTNFIMLQEYSCDGFTALPVDIQGTEYYAIGWENDGNSAASMIGRQIIVIRLLSLSV
jgi:hypothetical protein